MPRPTPKANEVLIKVIATTVTIGDCRMRSFTVPPEQWLFARLYLGIWKPRRKILGMELAGDVEAVGQGVTHFKPGDPVFASTFEVGTSRPDRGQRRPHLPTSIRRAISARFAGSVPLF